jgi:ribosomal protein L35AE/L33A
LLGELYKEADPAKAKEYLQKAFVLAKTAGDKAVIRKKIEQPHGNTKPVDMKQQN